LFVAGAIFAAWHRQRQAAHARSWAYAFALTGIGWVAAAVSARAADLIEGPGTAAQLAWLAAGLCFVHGLRQRHGIADLSVVLAAIWAGIAFSAALLLDLAPDGRFGGAGAALLDAVGLLVGTAAIGPRRPPRRAIDWCSILVLLGLALIHLLTAWSLIAGALSWAEIDLVVIAVTLGYVAAGLGSMLLISRDLSLALERLARTDPLTGVWNRRGFDEAAPVLLARARRRHPLGQAAVAIADLDAFKSINDRFGHQVGDAVLARFASQLRAALGPGDLVARLGGEEFVLLFPQGEAVAVRERLEAVRHAMAQTGADETALLPQVTTSFGLAAIVDGDGSLRDAMERADRALYRAKQDGRNRTVMDGA
jgi:diguanylate cyclase (GGDEF)-like protein